MLEEREETCHSIDGENGETKVGELERKSRSRRWMERSTSLQNRFFIVNGVVKILLSRYDWRDQAPPLESRDSPKNR